MGTFRGSLGRRERENLSMGGGGKNVIGERGLNCIIYKNDLFQRETECIGEKRATKPDRR